MTPYYADDWLTVYGGDCRAVLIELSEDYIDQALHRIAEDRCEGTGEPLDMPVEPPADSLWQGIA